MLTYIKGMVERSPLRASFLRTLHDTWNFNRTTPKLTPYGFNSWGTVQCKMGHLNLMKAAFFKGRFISDQTEVFVDS